MRTSEIPFWICRSLQVGREMLEKTKVFYTDMFAAKPALKLARLCREMGILTVFNLQCSPTFMESCKVARDELEEMISLCHLFCVGREGLRGLTPMADERQAALYLNGKYAPLGELSPPSGKRALSGPAMAKTSPFRPSRSRPSTLRAQGTRLREASYMPGSSRIGTSGRRWRLPTRAGQSSACSPDHGSGPMRRR